MKRLFGRLQIKIAVSMLFFVIVPVMAINLGLQLHMKNHILKNTDFAFENAVLNVDNTLKTLLREMGVTLNLLSTDSTLYDALESPKDTFNKEIHAKINIDNITAQFQKYVFYCTVDFLILDKNQTAYSTYFIQDKNIWTSPSTKLFLDEIDRNNLNYTYFSTSMKTLGKDSDNMVLCIGKTIRNYKKQYLGQAILIVEEDKLFRILQNSTLYTDSTNLLCSQDGTIISAKDKALIGTPYSSYLKDKEDYYTLSYELYNKWTFNSLIRRTDLYRESSYITYFIISDIVLTICFMAAIMLILHSFLKPVRRLKELMVNVENGDFTSRFHSDADDELTDLGTSFNHMTEKLSVLFRRTQTQQQKLLQQENEKEKFRYMVLQSQINPHLMFNTLNNIKWMALINHDQPVANTISSFGRLLEKTLKSGGDNFTIREELEYIKEYLQVMQLHIPQKISLAVEVADSSLYDCLILKMLFQPVVENSILHGFKNNLEYPQITINIKKRESMLVCTLSDNGSGMTREQLEGIYDNKDTNRKLSHSIGLSNTRERLLLFYGHDASLTVTSIPSQGTVAEFSLPLISSLQ
ncbi:MAG: histidine kinase [Eubacteriales bacterium]|nr:histidine kinase [Eubacteriales bacterium]